MVVVHPRALMSDVAVAVPSPRDHHQPASAGAPLELCMIGETESVRKRPGRYAGAVGSTAGAVSCTCTKKSASTEAEATSIWKARVPRSPTSSCSHALPVMGGRGWGSFACNHRTSVQLRLGTWVATSRCGRGERRGCARCAGGVQGVSGGCGALQCTQARLVLLKYALVLLKYALVLLVHVDAEEGEDRMVEHVNLSGERISRADMDVRLEAAVGSESRGHLHVHREKKGDAGR